VVVEGDRRNLREGSASFVPAGRPATLAAAESAAVLAARTSWGPAVTMTSSLSWTSSRA
jgi:hypothetical protein